VIASVSRIKCPKNDQHTSCIAPPCRSGRARFQVHGTLRQSPVGAGPSLWHIGLPRCEERQMRSSREQGEMPTTVADRLTGPQAAPPHKPGEAAIGSGGAPRRPQG